MSSTVEMKGFSEVSDELDGLTLDVLIQSGGLEDDVLSRKMASLQSSIASQLKQMEELMDSFCANRDK